MSSTSTQVKVLKETLDTFIHSTSNAHLDVLETLYHDEMKVYMFDKSHD